MITVWALVAVLGSACVVLLRDLIALHRSRLRRASLERLAFEARSGFRVVDRDADGSTTEVTAAPSPGRGAMAADEPETDHVRP
ncbi:hypothetical protein [Saccharopolyspora taberi]|uniref:Uncharacterized protein n=1 Tax=Saccharopolyspora taberi TaxID=60895 RepID=A0ABN3VL69_9PSEU